MLHYRECITHSLSSLGCHSWVYLGVWNMLTAPIVLMKTLHTLQKHRVPNIHQEINDEWPRKIIFVSHLFPYCCWHILDSAPGQSLYCYLYVRSPTHIHTRTQVLTGRKLHRGPGLGSHLRASCGVPILAEMEQTRRCDRPGVGLAVKDSAKGTNMSLVGKMF